jgi:hypothetical protein
MPDVQGRPKIRMNANRYPSPTAGSKTRASETKALWSRLISTEHTSALRPQGRVRYSYGAESVPY